MLRKLEAISAELEAAVFAPETLANALHMAGEGLGYDHFCLVHSNIHELQVVSAEHSMEAFRAYEAGGWVETDYRAATVNLSGPGKLYLDHVVVPEAQRLSSGIYHDLYLPQKMAFFAGWSASVGEESWIFSLARSQERGPVGPDEARLLADLMPYANRALTFAKRIRDARTQSIADFAIRLGLPLIILDSDGKAMAVAPQAERCFDAEFGVRNGGLWAADSESNNALEALCHLARSTGLPALVDNVVVRRRAGRRALLLRPIPIRGLGLDVLPGARLFVTVTDLDRPPATPEHDLRLLFGLSPAEANVAALLASGLDVQEVAAQRDATVGTIRVQIKNVFEKMDVNRLGELVSVVANVTRLSDAPDET